MDRQFEGEVFFCRPNEGSSTLTAPVVCAKCHKPLNDCQEYIVRQYRSATMSAPSFEYMHCTCAAEQIKDLSRRFYITSDPFVVMVDAARLQELDVDLDFHDEWDECEWVEINGTPWLSERDKRFNQHCIELFDATDGEIMLCRGAVDDGEVYLLPEPFGQKGAVQYHVSDSLPGLRTHSLWCWSYTEAKALYEQVFQAGSWEAYIESTRYMPLIVDWCNGTQEKYDTLQEAREGIQAEFIETAETPTRIHCPEDGMEYECAFCLSIVPVGDDDDDDDDTD